MLGLLLLLVGLAYFALFAFVLGTQTLDLSRRTIGVLSFFAAFGALLIWVGSRFLNDDIDNR